MKQYYSNKSLLVCIKGSLVELYNWILWGNLSNEFKDILVVVTVSSSRLCDKAVLDIVLFKITENRIWITILFSISFIIGSLLFTLLASSYIDD